MKKKLELKLVGKISVESGELLILDPAFFDNQDVPGQQLTDAVLETDLLEIFDKNKEQFKDLNWEDIPRNPEAISKLKSFLKVMGSVNFPSSSGYYFACKVPMDGVYSIFAKFNKDEVAGLYIDFENFADD